jgi:hypothetical protein
MNNNYHAEIRDSIVNINFDGRKVVLFGANSLGLDVIALLKEYAIDLYAVVDNNPLKAGERYAHLHIANPESILKKNIQDKIILIASRFYEEITGQLREWGGIENTNIFQIARINESFHFKICSDEKWKIIENDVFDGFEVYKDIIERHGSTVKIHLAAVSSIGDIFLLSLYFRQYLNRYGIENDYIILIPGENATKLAHWRGLEAASITPGKAAQLLKFAMLVGFEASNIMLLHTGYIHTRIWSRMLAWKKQSWLEHCREVLLLPPETLPERVFPVWSEKDVEHLFTENNLPIGKTVILAPYTNNVRQLPVSFWSRLAALLACKGYAVCTNIGLATETPISGTLGLRFALEDAVGALQYAGYFIASRSGLCDIIASARCRKIILYSNEIWDFISVYDFCSLKKMGLCDDAEEYVYEFDEDDMLDKIAGSLPTFALL